MPTNNKGWDAGVATHPTDDKLVQLRGLQDGWYYGSGSAIDPRTIETVSNLNQEARNLLMYGTNVFPADSGELFFEVSSKGYVLEFIVDQERIVSAFVYHDDEELDFQEGLTLKSAKEELRIFRDLVWKLSDSSAGRIGTQASKDSTVPPFIAQRATTESPSSPTTALWKKAARSVSMFSASTPRTTDYLQFSGA